MTEELNERRAEQFDVSKSAPETDVPECPHCEGQGEICYDCEFCGGDGEVDCDDCNGEGSVECRECSGESKDSDGELCEHCDEGRVSCDNCWTGIIECEECDNGQVCENCENCDGSGYETE